MNTFLVILNLVSLNTVEIIIFQLGAILLGFSLHFFLTAKKNMRLPWQNVLPDSGIAEADEWRLKYYENMDVQRDLQQKLRDQLEAARVKESALQEEIEGLEEEVKNLRLDIKDLQNAPPPAAEYDTTDQPQAYLKQLGDTRNNLLQHNQQIVRLLEQVEMLKETEQKYQELLKTNQNLYQEVWDLRKKLTDRETEIKETRQQQLLVRELQGRLEQTHQEYNALQDKLQKVEGYLAKPQVSQLEYEDLQQSYFRLTKEYDEVKLRYLSLLEESQRVSRLLADTEDKLRESNFQRQQLGKKISFLEELNQDLQTVAGHQKKLESQLHRLNEIEQLMTRAQRKKDEE